MGACGSRNNGGFKLTPAQNSNPVAAAVAPLAFGLRKAANYIQESNLIVFDACCCFNTYLYTEFPQCLGVACTAEVLCCDMACCLKPNTSRLACLCCEGRCQRIDRLCKGQVHACCVVESCTCPPGDGEPIMFAKLFVVCYPNIGICMPQSSVMMRI